uniref:Uncharacterized protein n=1 Tax=Panagrellus redivivus TaxID=6233 RepID=A0A7E4VJ26_PANRE
MEHDDGDVDVTPPFGLVTIATGTPPGCSGGASLPNMVMMWIFIYELVDFRLLRWITPKVSWTVLSAILKARICTKKLSV